MKKILLTLFLAMVAVVAGFFFWAYYVPVIMAKEAVKLKLTDPDSAQFRNVRKVDAVYVCGEVNAKTRIRHDKPIASFLSRLQGGKFGSVEIVAKPQDAVGGPDETRKEVIAKARADRVTRSAEGSAAGKATVAGVAPSPSELEECRSALGVAINWLHFERALNLIFGTQFEFLKALRVRQNNAIGVPEVTSTFFAQHAKALGATANYAHWSGFLLSLGFVEIPKDDVQVLRLTGRGMEFLTYLENQYRAGIPYRLL